MALLPSPQKASEVSASCSLGNEARLTPESLAWVDEKLKEPGWARQFLIDSGLIDAQGRWNTSYWPEDGKAGQE
jgi:hypothetical protein